MDLGPKLQNISECVTPQEFRMPFDDGEEFLKLIWSDFPFGGVSFQSENRRSSLQGIGWVVCLFDVYRLSDRFHNVTGLCLDHLHFPVVRRVNEELGDCSVYVARLPFVEVNESRESLAIEIEGVCFRERKWILLGPKRI